MEEMSQTLKVIESTNRPNLIERLTDLQKELTICEKALAEYLETKRLAFPRFYFVSSADLLDILSNGNNPDQVIRYSIVYTFSPALRNPSVVESILTRSTGI